MIQNYYFEDFLDISLKSCLVGQWFWFEFESSNSKVFSSINYKNTHDSYIKFFLFFKKFN